MAVSEEQISKAFEKLKPEFIANVTTTSLKKVRRALEQELDLSEGTLDAFKPYITLLVDEMMQSIPSVAEEPPSAEKTSNKRTKHTPADKQPSKTKAASSEQGHGSAGDEQHEPSIASDEDQEQPKKKKSKSRSDAASKKGKAQPQEPRQPVVHSRLVNKLRDVCKRATITIAPALYKKFKNDDDGLAEAIENLLRQHELTANSGEREISRAKRRLAKHRDLDGIDTSNIISEGPSRPRRAAAAAAQENYRSMLNAAVTYEPEEKDEDSEEEEEEEGEGGEESSGSDTKALSGEEGEEEEEEEEPKASKDAPKAGAKKQVRGGDSGTGSGEEEEDAPKAGAKTPTAGKDAPKGGAKKQAGGNRSVGSPPGEEEEAGEGTDVGSEWEDAEEEGDQPPAPPPPAPRGTAAASAAVGARGGATNTDKVGKRAAASPDETAAARGGAGKVDKVGKRPGASPDENSPPKRAAAGKGNAAAAGGPSRIQPKGTPASQAKQAPGHPRSAGGKGGAGLEDADTPAGAAAAPKRRRLVVSDSD